MDEPFGALDPHTKSMMQLAYERNMGNRTTQQLCSLPTILMRLFSLANKIYVMSARPGKIIKEVNVYLPHKRDLELKDSPEFIKIRKSINDLLYSANTATEE